VINNSRWVSSVLTDGGRSERRSAPPRDGPKFVASFAHEINNPLDALLNLLFLIEDDPSLSEETRQCVVLARQEADRMSHIAHGAMKELHESAAPSTAPNETNVPELLAAVIEFYKTRFDSRGITVDTRDCGDGNLALHSGVLRQAFSNLLLNAADAMPNGGKIYARVSPAHEWAGQGRRGLRVTIADNGCGIAADDLPRILTPSFTTKGSAGNGIGLSVVQDAVLRNCGTIRVRSNTDKHRHGTVFMMFLPSA
jgi:signal transduction histidine kinase